MKYILAFLLGCWLVIVIRFFQSGAADILAWAGLLIVSNTTTATMIYRLRS